MTKFRVIYSLSEVECKLGTLYPNTTSVYVRAQYKDDITEILRETLKEPSVTVLEAIAVY